MIRMVESTNELIEKNFNLTKIQQNETLMTQGNGYMGMRASHEEDYVGGVRGLYIAGTYNKDSEYEVAELPNLADTAQFEITLNGEIFRLDQGTVLDYNRRLVLATGELIRTIEWAVGENRYNLVFRRFVSQNNLHLVVSQVEITPRKQGCTMTAKTGINGRMTNSGTQNMHESSKRVFENRYMQYVQKTTQTDIEVVFSSVLDSNTDGTNLFISERRKLLNAYTAVVAKDETFVLTKKTVINTSLDKEQIVGIDELKKIESKSYEQLLQESNEIWKSETGIKIQSDNNFDQFAINFAAYHLKIMTPTHDHRFSIGAKGLTGEGYKAHIFWDTEIFLLPYHLYNNPEAAKQLLAYRFSTLDNAIKKAQANGFDGALFPWESALTGEEETPEFAAMNIKTGHRERVHSAAKEHHIVADIAYSVLQYEKATGDEQFMQDMGLCLLVESSKFWVSRADKTSIPYSIKDVIGPDEYTEHIDNNAYTNYMAHHVVSKTIEKIKYYNATINEQTMNSFCDFVKNLYLPKPNEQNIIPQDDSFFSKPIINLDKYRNSAGKQTILQDYTRAEVVDMQILKQSDAVMLLYTLPELFSKKVCEATWHYYEPKTIHDSSLSMCIHSIVALKFGEVEKAYDCFEKGARIDLGENASSGDGIHAAALGSLYLAVVFGFGGVNVERGAIVLNPKLPKTWSELAFPFTYQGQQIICKINKEKIVISRLNEQAEDLHVKVGDQKYILEAKTQSLEIIKDVEEQNGSLSKEII